MEERAVRGRKGKRGRREERTDRSVTEAGETLRDEEKDEGERRGR